MAPKPLERLSGGGLSLKAAKAPGQRHPWRFDYINGNKRQALSLGGYSFVGLEEVRALASQVRQPLGVAEGVLTADLCRDLRGALKKPSVKHFELALVIHTSQRWSPCWILALENYLAESWHTYQCILANRSARKSRKARTAGGKCLREG